MATVTRLTRAEFHELVWSKPMKDLPEVFGVSATSVRNACRKFDIPIPDRGHWNRVNAGKTVRQVPLPDRSPGMSNEITLGGFAYDGCYHRLKDWDEPLPAPPSFDRPIEDIRESVSRKIGRVVVPRGKHGWHTAIQRLFAADDKRRQKIAESKWAFSWDKPLFDNPFEQRRLKILNALFLGVAKCGGKPNIQGKEAIDISLAVHQQHVPLKLLATSDAKRKDSYRNTDDQHTAKEPLSLIVPTCSRGDKTRIVWADEPDVRLETRLTEITVELVVLAEVFHREHAQRHHDWLVERREDHKRRNAEAEAARREAIRVRKEKFEAAKRSMLLGHARDIDDAQRLRQLVDDVLKQKSDLSDETAAWARFVRTEADRLDPVFDDRFLDVMRLRLEDFGDDHE